LDGAPGRVPYYYAGADRMEAQVSAAHTAPWHDMIQAIATAMFILADMADRDLARLFLIRLVLVIADVQDRWAI
jgi:hypothetical protein